MTPSQLVLIADRYVLDSQVLASRLNRDVLTETDQPTRIGSVDLSRIDLVLVDADVRQDILADALDRARAVGLLHDGHHSPRLHERACDPRVRLVASRAGTLEDLVDCVMRALHGAVHKAFPFHARLAREGPSLSPRENEVLRLLAKGLGNRDIATELQISPHTVRTHVQALLGKLDRGSRVAAVGAARQAGLLSQ